jgi:predicted amidohydrolase
VNNILRIALANLRFPSTPAESVQLAEQGIVDAAKAGAHIVCFGECYVPGYRAPNKNVPPPDEEFLTKAWARIADTAGKSNIAVVLGTERIVDDRLLATALVINADGSVAGFQDKVQVDPSEDNLYTPGVGRQVFSVNGVKFGVVICHEGWRYPETVRAAVRQGAKIVFHPHFHEAEPGSYRPTSFADPLNTFHEKACLCRAAENSCYFATVNYAGDGSPTTSAVVQPDGTLHSFQPYGVEGIFTADIDPNLATGLLAKRLRLQEA